MSTSEFPSNPWNDPEVVWLIPPEVTEPRDETFRRLASDPNRTHIVRQVHISNPTLTYRTPATQGEAEDTVVLVESEYDKLERLGIELARPSWHIIPRTEQEAHKRLSQRFIHILARVPVVTGWHPLHKGDRSHLPAHEIEGIATSVVDYLNQVKLGDPYLCDIKRLSQYIFGIMRTEASDTPERSLMVDPDIYIEINNGRTPCIE